MDLTCKWIPDLLERYHPYTAAYRRDESTLYTDFGPHNPRDIESCLAVARANGWAGDRAALAKNLIAYHDQFDAPEASRKNAASLAEPNTFAIVAGHQPSLFGGPLFLVYKLLSIIKLSSMLNAQQSEFHFVPIYWNGSEEHNRAEFGRVTFFDREHDLLHLTLPEHTGKRMAAATDASEALPLLDEIAKMLPHSEFLPDLLKTIREAATDDLGGLMTHLMLHWFGKHGLVVMEPRIIRTQATPIIKRALQDPVSLHDMLGEDTEEMKARGFKPPLPHHEAERTLVYLIEDGERYRLRKQSGTFSVETRNETYDEETLFDLLENSPERFSPSAALRPIVQAATLPVTAYVAGGGELAYHVQLRKLYRTLEQPIPLLIPRVAGTILKKSLVKAANKLQIDDDQLLSESWTWEAVASNSVERVQKLDAAFDVFYERLEQNTEHLKTALADQGIQNFNELTREIERCQQRLGGVRARYDKQSSTETDSARRQFFRLRKFILPGESYQELSCWSLYMIALFGEGLFDAMLAQIKPLDSNHHLFMIG